MTAAQDTITAVAAWLDGLAAGLGQSSNYLAARGAEAAQTAAALRAIDWSGTDPTPTPQKGSVTFLADIGQLARDPTRETTHAVDVSRSGSTHAPATVAAQVTGAAAAAVVAVDPAEFKAGQARSQVFVRLSPSGAAQGAAATSPLAGLAGLLRSADLDLGPKPTASLQVVDRSAPPPPPPGDKWWIIPGGNRSGKPWNRGVNSTGWNKSTCADYERQVSPLDVFCAANHHGAVILGTSWAEFQAQAFFNNSSGFGALLQSKVKDKTLHLLNFYTHPVGIPLQEIVDGKHDAQYVQFGQNLRVSVDKAGLSDWQLGLRTNKEGNQDEYLTSQAQAHLYGLGVGRAIKGIRKGYGMTSRGRLRFSFSPARGLLVGPLEGFCSFDDDGSCLFDVMSVSTHPANQLNGLAGKSRDVQKAGVRDWLAGSYKEGYSYLHKNPAYSVLALARKYKLPISLDEWSPRFEPTMYCAIADAAFEAIHDFLAEHANELAWDCVFHSNVLTESDSVCPGWAAASKTYKRLWKS